MKNNKRSIGLFLTIAIGLILLNSDNQCLADAPNPGKKRYFSKAQPIWPTGRELEKNLTIGFRAHFKRPSDGNAVLRITGSTIYRIFLNGQFVGHGPARAGQGYYRVDEWNLSKKLLNGNNILAIEVVGYNVNSYYVLDQPSFVQAEVVSGKKVIAATSSGSGSFEAFQIDSRVQKVPRFSFQRPFVEYYQMKHGCDQWRTDLAVSIQKLPCEQVESKNLIERRVTIPNFMIRLPASVDGGFLKTGISRDTYWKDRAVLNIGNLLGGFPESELVLNPAIPLQEIKTDSARTGLTAYSTQSRYPMTHGQFKIFDFGTNLTGFIETEIEMVKSGRIYLTFDEILTNGDVDFKRLSCINAVTYDLAPGTYSLASFEPYTMRYLKVAMIDGVGTIKQIDLREYANSDIHATFESSDQRLNRIYIAAVETFRQNAVDIFMDCPHRERAGWLCDSYFTSRVASDLSGNTLIEKNFLENYLLPDSFPHLPKGMLPMCYPSDHYNGNFIPNWAMWFVLELKEYLSRSNDAEMVNQLKPKVMNLLNYFQSFENADGLLEKLKAWIFVEWSDANKWVQDVNYPTNMLYAATLEAAGEMYGIDSLRTEAATIRQTIRNQSFNGTFFVDNAVRNAQGKLETTHNTSEVCQYYAFYLKTATPELYPDLWDKLANQFGPERQKNNIYPDVRPANAFIGNYLRLELLSEQNLRAQLLDESINYFDYMALKTGTLWENISATASCNHGFASHVAHILYRDVLGIANINSKTKEITIQFSDLPLTSCKGTIPVGQSMIKLEWVKKENEIIYHCEVPDGYNLIVINDSGLKLARK